MKKFDFVPPEGTGCHQYVVVANNVEEAQVKFKKWQKENLRKDERWPDDYINNNNSWSESSIYIIK